jgi:hypothetical protein
MIGDIVAALFIFYFVLPLAGAAVLWVISGLLKLFAPSTPSGKG